MYESHFGMRRRPFRPIPDSQCYYPASSPELALARLVQAIGDDEGLLLVTGDVGTGKTLLGQCLVERLGEGIDSAFLTNSHFPDRSGLFQAILFDLGQPQAQRGEQEWRLALTEYLLGNYSAGRRTLLVVDEAQHLSVDLLEELRLLGNLEGRQGKAVQVVLLGQPALLETLDHPELAPLRQRLAVRVRLEPLPPEEASDYLVWHLRAVGARPDQVFGDEALELLTQRTQGIPRLLNQAAHAALTLAFQAGASEVDAEAALEALASLGLEAEAEPAALASFAAEETHSVAAARAEIEERPPVRKIVQDVGTDSSRAHRLFTPPRHVGRHTPRPASDGTRAAQGRASRDEE